MQPAGAELEENTMKIAVGQERDAKSQTRMSGNDTEATVQSRAMLGQKRKRVLRACDECRREKIGCDGKLPCAHCNVYGYDCTYNQPSNRGRNSSKYIEELEARLHKAQALLRITAPDLDLNDPRISTSSPEQIMTASRRGTPRDARGVKLATDRILNENSRGADGADGGDESLLETMMENLGSLDIDDRGYWDYRGHSSSIIFLQRLHNQLGRLIDPSHSAVEAWPMSQIREGPAQHIGPQQASNNISSCPKTCDLPSKECARVLCRGGLQHTCVLLRFIHEPSFWGMFDRIYAVPWDQMGSDDQKFLPLLYIVLAVGCCVADVADTTLGIKDFEDIVARGFQYFRACRQLIDITDCRDLTTLQAICFMILFLQASAKLSISYAYIGLAQRAALRLGLHRSVAANFTPIERELRKRIFWVVRSMDVYVSTICGLPLAVNDDDIDQEYPLEIDDEYITPAGILPMPPGRISLMVGANAHASLVDIMVKVLKYIYPVRIARAQTRPGRTYMVSHSKIREIEVELDAWSAALPPPLKPGQEGYPELERMREQLQINHAYVQWILYRPFLHSVSNGLRTRDIDSRSYACASACLSASRRIVNTVSGMYKKHLINGSYWFAMHATYVAVLTLVFFVLENTDVATIEDGVVNDAFEGKDILAALAKDSVALKRCACLYSLFKFLPGKARNSHDTATQAEGLKHRISSNAATETKQQYPSTMILGPDQILSPNDRPTDERNASQAWHDLISQMFPASSQFTLPVKPVPSPENVSNSHTSTSSAQCLKGFTAEFDMDLPNGNALSNSNVIYDRHPETNIPGVTDILHDMQPQTRFTGTQSSVPKIAQNIDLGNPTPNPKSQEMTSSTHGSLSTDLASQIAMQRTNDAWMNDIWMSGVGLNKVSSMRTGLEMDIGFDDVFPPNLSASTLNADLWGQWWDTGA